MFGVIFGCHSSGVEGMCYWLVGRSQGTAKILTMHKAGSLSAAPSPPPPVRKYYLVQNVTNSAEIEKLI